MTRVLFLAPLLAVAIGCATPPLTPPPAGTYLPTLAASAGIASVLVDASPTPGPGPGPTPPAPGPRMCEACNGKGWVGDGTIRNKCGPCDGKGWFDAFGLPMDAPWAEDLIDGEGLLKRVAEIEAQLKAAPDAAPVEESTRTADRFEAAHLRAQLRGKPLLVFAWNKSKEADFHNRRIELACKSVPDIVNRFAFFECELSDQWDATKTVAEQFELPTHRTSLVIVSPDSRKFVRVQSLEDLK